MHKSILMSVVLAAACGGSKPSPEPMPPPPGGGDVIAPSTDPAPPDADAGLVAEAKTFVVEMDQELRRLYTDASVAAWANETDITPAHEEAAAKAGAEQAKGITRLIKAARKFEPVHGQARSRDAPPAHAAQVRRPARAR